MESQNPLPPSYVAHFASSGNIGPTVLAYNTPGIMETNWSVQEEESSAIGLNLELGRGSCQKLDNKRFHGFTILQLHELQLQALIFKYIEAGLPVPYHLVLPIWQSFSTTLGSLNNGLLPYFPNSLGAGPVCLDSRKGMDTEPWRCRRTDGKKWRCSKEALPQQKYCERHIHRGRHRSRKLVDSSKYTHNGVSKTTMANTSSGGVIGSNSNMTDLSISLPVSKNSTSIALFSSLG